MPLLRELGKTVVRPILKVSQFDLRCARLRLEEFGVRHADLGGVLSPHDDPGVPNERLIDLLLALISRTRQTSLASLADRNPPDLLELWPGEHYRLLAALMLELKPQTVIEIGTFKGLSALAMLAYLPPGGQLTTFDLIPWEQIPGTFLRETDFASGNFTQALCDLKDPENCRMHASLIKNADVIFIDGPKDGVFEGKLLENFAAVGLRQHTVLVFDDIHIWNMLGVWLRIRHPKLDITTIGHYTGTGIVEWLPSAT